MRALYIFDLDGTLADISHRVHLIDNVSREPDWPAFYKACVDDKPITTVIQTLSDLRVWGDVWIFTGRSDEVRTETEAWLNEHVGHYDWLQMRHAGDYRPDHVLKLGWLNSMLVDDRQRLVAIFEDRARMVQMWREQGITCFQVAEGSY